MTLRAFKETLTEAGRLYIKLFILSLLFVALSMLLGGCSSTPVVIEHRCLPQVTYTAAQVVGVVAELDKAELAGVSMPYTEAMIVGYKQMRRDNQTCLQASGK